MQKHKKQAGVANPPGRPKGKNPPLTSSERGILFRAQWGQGSALGKPRGPRQRPPKPPKLNSTTMIHKIMAFGWETDNKSRDAFINLRAKGYDVYP